MGSGWAVAVTVVGSVSIVGLLGLLARHLGLWTWVVAWLKAATEEKAHLCRSQRNTSTRSYLFDNDLDWIGLWPRTGSYKRFTNLDDLTNVPIVDDPSARPVEEPDLPPQPLRPAPAPPPRMGGWTDSGEGSPSPASSVGLGIETPPEPTRPAPVLDRRDSNRSLTGRISRRDSSKELLASSQQSSPKRASTNPFRASWVPPDESSEESFTQNSFGTVSEPCPVTTTTATVSQAAQSGPAPTGSKSQSELSAAVNGPDLPTTAAPASTQGSHIRARPVGLQDKDVRCTMVNGTKESVAGGSDLRDTLSNVGTMNHETSVHTIRGPGASKYDTSSSAARSTGSAQYDAFYSTGRGVGSVQYDTSSLAGRGVGTMPYDTPAPAGRGAWSPHPDTAGPGTAATMQYDTSTPTGRGAGTTKQDTSAGRVAGTTQYETSSPAGRGTGTIQYDTSYPGVRSSGATQYDSSFPTARSVYEKQVNKVYEGSARREDLSVGESPDVRNYATNTTDRHKHDIKKYEGSSWMNDTLLDGGTSAIITSTSYDKLAARVDDVKLDSKKSTSTPQMPQLVMSTELVSLDTQVTSDLSGRSYEVPTTPPNTATFPLSPRSPHIASRLAELEARMRLLGAQAERDTSQDWWPSDPSPAPSSIVGVEKEVPRGGRKGRNPFVVSVGDREDGLSSVDEEEVFLLQDDHSHRTQVSRENSSLSGSDGQKASVGVVSEESEEDASARRVREYIASLSARLRQIPDQDESARGSPDYMDTPPTSATYPATPPNSLTKDSQDSTDTPPSSAGPYTPYGSGRASSTTTPPNSATLRNLYSTRRASADVSPASPGVFSLSINRRLSLDTPPSSAGLVTATPPNSATSQLAFGDTPPSSAGYSSTPPNSAGLTGSFDAGLVGGGVSLVGGGAGQTLKRAMSCDSVSSDTSVTLGELEDTCGQVTGHLAVQLIYDSDTADLEVVVVEGRDLVGPDPHVAVDSYVRVFLLPDKSTNMQTRVCRRTNSPTYRERFLFALEEEEVPHRSLAFYMYASDKFTNTLIGEAQLRLSDFELSGPCSTVVPLTDMGQKGVGYGEIMFSLSYLPTAERLTVVVVKARSLQWTGDKTSADPFVKVYVLQNGKKVMKKKTSVKKDSRSPVFNEAMIFSVPAPALHNIQLRVTVAEHNSEGGQARSVGHVIVGTQATGKALSHWNQMMSALRKPIGMWHPLRR